MSEDQFIRSWVYFIRQVGGGPVKIGFTGDPEIRLEALQTASPHRLEIIGVIRGGAALEEALHLGFAACRMAGEWFQEAAELLDYINRRARPWTSEARAEADHLRPEGRRGRKAAWPPRVRYH